MTVLTPFQLSHVICSFINFHCICTDVLFLDSVLSLSSGIQYLHSVFVKLSLHLKEVSPSFYVFIAPRCEISV